MKKIKVHLIPFPSIMYQERDELSLYITVQIGYIRVDRLPMLHTFRQKVLSVQLQLTYIYLSSVEKDKCLFN